MVVVTVCDASIIYKCVKGKQWDENGIERASGGELLIFACQEGLIDLVDRNVTGGSGPPWTEKQNTGQAGSFEAPQCRSPSRSEKISRLDAGIHT